MLRTSGRHLRHNAVSYLALFIAMTGTAYAAGPLKSGDRAGGDLAGTYPHPTIRACSDGQILKFNGSAGGWACAQDAVGGGLNGYEVVSASAAPGSRVADAQCSPGKKVIGGGGATSTGLYTSAPLDDTGWGALSNADATGVRVWAICASIAP